MYILLSGKVPFPGRNELEIIGNVIKGEYHFNHEAFRDVSVECKDLICHLLEKDVSKRFTALQACNHPWILKYSGQDVHNNPSFPDSVFVEMKDVMSLIATRKASLCYLAGKVPEANLQMLKESFLTYDKEGKGTVTSDLFMRCLSTANMKATEREVKILMKELD